ncbi:MAG: hypothetical protein ACFB50_05095 [Rubrobacteraceae bacterium]
MSENRPDGSTSGSQDLGVMQGEGFYNRHSKPQHSVVELGLSLLPQAVEAVPLPVPGEVFSVADYGVAGGRNSVEPVRMIIDTVRRRAGQDLPVSVVHTDIPANDFNPLFGLLSSPEGYLAGLSNVFAYVEGRSFYERLFPDAQVHVGWSASAVNWLSSVPAPIPDHIWSNRATGRVREAFAGQSGRDWRQFLDHRRHELKPGGRLVVLGNASDDYGSTGAEGLLDLANGALQEMVQEKILGPDEYGRMVIPTYNRTLEEYEAPFSEAGIADDLELESASVAALEDPFWAEYQQNGDLGAYADSYADFFQAAGGSSLLAALDEGRSDIEGQEILGAFHEKLKSKVAADPAAAVCNWLIACLLISRKPAS